MEIKARLVPLQWGFKELTYGYEIRSLSPGNRLSRAV
jgi:hypothetical protein